MGFASDTGLSINAAEDISVGVASVASDTGSDTTGSGDGGSDATGSGANNSPIGTPNASAIARMFLREGFRTPLSMPER